MLSLILLSSLSFGQSNSQRLEDLEDKLDMMRAEQDYRNAQRIFEQQNRESKVPPPTMSHELKSLIDELNQPYKNKKSEELRISDAKFYNLTMSEYLRRDEISYNACKNISDTEDSMDCGFSKMLNISFTETRMRRRKALMNCSKLDEVRKKDCHRSVLVLGKQR